MSAAEPFDKPLEPEEVEMLMAIRDVWCQANRIPEGFELHQQILLDLIDWYQAGARSAEDMYVRLGLQAVARASLASAVD